MEKSHALLLALGFAAGLLVGAFFTMGGEGATPVPPAAPPAPPAPTAVRVACRIDHRLTPEQATERLDIPTASGAPASFALACTPRP